MASHLDVEDPPASSQSRSSTFHGCNLVRQSGAQELSRSFINEPPADTDAPALLSGNIRVLLFTAMLFTTITVAQSVAATIAHSAALMADCVSMGADALSYFMNIGVELREGKRFHRQLELICPTISILILVYFTMVEALGALGTLQGDADDGEPVNPWIVMAFAIWGIVFDCFALKAFLSNTDGGSAQSNMMSALLHVGADFARSITTLVESMIIIFFHVDSVKIDAWACMMVSGTILLGAVAAVVEIVKDFRAHGCASKDDAREATIITPNST